MEKRLITFLLLASLVMLGYAQLQLVLNPPPVEEVAEVDAELAADGEGNAAKQPVVAEVERADGFGENEVAAEGDADLPDAPLAPQKERDAGDATSNDAEQGDIPRQQWVLGSLDPASPYQMAVYFTNVGAAIERIELNDPRYQDLDRKYGWLGNLDLSDDQLGGCRVSTVPPGSPAAAAEALTANAGQGLRGPTFENVDGQIVEKTPGDRIVQFDGQDIADALTFQAALEKTRPKQQVDLTVMRSNAQGNEQKIRYRTTLVRRPLAVVAPEPETLGEDQTRDQLSFLWTLGRAGDAKVGMGKNEISGLPSLWNVNWRAKLLPAVNGLGEGIEFSRRLSKKELAAVGSQTSLTFVKRYRLTPIDRQDEQDKFGSAGYAIQMELEIQNTGDEDLRMAYQLDGPTGLPLEGWWYSYKVHPRRFGLAGARDIAWREVGGRHELFLCSEITKNATSEEKNHDTPLTEASPTTKLAYAGGDAQYFSVVMLPGKDSGKGSHTFAKAVARAVGPPDEKRKKRTNTTLRLTSRNIELTAGDTFREDFTIFAGPKQQQVLAKFGLDELIVYGWFGAIAKPMSSILHFFYNIIGSWGLAIVMLTVLVRGCMYPLGRKMALNAQKMQELAPEMKKITDKYKDDLEKRSQAQRELFTKNNYNPFAGCLVMFLQFPVFIGLYRALSVDISLRQAPFFPGISWCSNLAGPDMLWYWEPLLPAALAAPTGWLGPYLNILPLFATGLMMLQQKMFTPPPQDEQQEMQQNIMKFMMLFMTVIFFKIAAGLCIYFVASSLWGIAERKLLPKTKPADSQTPAKPKPTLAGAVAGARSNGAGGSQKKKKKRRRK